MSSESRPICILLLSDLHQRSRHRSGARAEGALFHLLPLVCWGGAKWEALCLTSLIRSDPGVWIRRDLKGPTQYQEIWPSRWGKEVRLGGEFKYTQEQSLVLRLSWNFPSPSVHGQVSFAVLDPEPQPKGSHPGRAAVGEEINLLAFAILLDSRYWKEKVLTTAQADR